MHRYICYWYKRVKAKEQYLAFSSIFSIKFEHFIKMAKSLPKIFLMNPTINKMYSVQSFDTKIVSIGGSWKMLMLEQMA